MGRYVQNNLHTERAREAIQKRLGRMNGDMQVLLKTFPQSYLAAEKSSCIA